MNRIERVRKPIPDLVVRPGETVMCDGRAVKILAVHSQDSIHIQVVGSCDISWVRLEQLSAFLPRNCLVGSVRTPDHANAEQEAKAKCWSRALSRIAEIHPTHLASTSCSDLAFEMGVSGKTVRRRWRIFQINSSPMAQLPSLPGPLRGSRHLAPVRESLISKAIDEVYLRRERPSVAAVHLRCAELARAVKVDVPSYGAIRSRILARDPMAVAKKRLGYDDAHGLLAPSIKGLDVNRPLQSVQIDHALVDLMVVSGITRQVIGRPWITVAIDVYTRCVLGYYLSFDTPDQTSVALAMEHACLPKHSWLTQLGVDVSYPMFGRMERVHWDNARTFQAKGIVSQCERFGIEVVPRPVRRPHYGAYIERYIGTMMGAVHLLPGSTFSNSKQRGSYQSEQRATLSIAELEKWIALEVAGNYHNKPHSGLDGLTPSQVWERAWARGNGTEKLPPLISDTRLFKLGFMPFVMRRVGREGIQVHGVHYWDPALVSFIKDRCDYRVHYSQRDLSRVYLHHNGMYVDIPAVDRSVGAFSAWELREAKKNLRALGKVAMAESEIYRAIEQQRKILEGAAAKSKVARKKQARLAQPSSTVGAIAPPDYSSPAFPIDTDEAILK